MRIRWQVPVGLGLGWVLVAVAGCGSESAPPAPTPPTPSPTATTASQGSTLHCDSLPFVENVYWTTDYGPAAADVVSAPTNLLPCNGPAYALCFYSGPEPLPCKVDEARGVALCQCYGYRSESETYENFIDIHGILNTCAYIETVRDCGQDGADCVATVNSAPACQYMNQSPQTLYPGADLISTFSFAKVKDYPAGCTECSGVYAGCMTAPCTEKLNEQGEPVVICECPLYDGPYQVGQGGASCDAGEGLVWSASYNPNGCSGS